MFMPSKTLRMVLITLDRLVRLSGGLRIDLTTGVTKLLTGSEPGIKILTPMTASTMTTLPGLWTLLMVFWISGVATQLFTLLSLSTSLGEALPEILLWISTVAYAL